MGRSVRIPGIQTVFKFKNPIRKSGWSTHLIKKSLTSSKRARLGTFPFTTFFTPLLIPTGTALMLLKLQTTKSKAKVRCRFIMMLFCLCPINIFECCYLLFSSCGSPFFISLWRLWKSYTFILIPFQIWVDFKAASDFYIFWDLTFEKRENVLSIINCDIPWLPVECWCSNVTMSLTVC